jgi:hypothetical protein
LLVAAKLNMDVNPLNTGSKRNRLLVGLGITTLCLSGAIIRVDAHEGDGASAGHLINPANVEVVRLGQLKNIETPSSDLPPPKILRPRGYRISEIGESNLAGSLVAPQIHTPAPYCAIRVPTQNVTLQSVTSQSVPMQATYSLPPRSGVQVVEATGITPMPGYRVQPVIIPDSSPSLLGTIGHQQLRDHAAQSIRSAQQRLDRGATYTAQKLAVDALRHIASSKDLISGTNQYSVNLTAALTAIRESNDFASTHGMADVSTMKRLVDSHQTTSLKGVDLEAMSALKATEIYLTTANRVLVYSFGDVPLAADAMILLGKVEKQIETDNPMHSGAVALTLHKAASEIAPHSGLAQRELGNTLMEQGLTTHAAEAFRRSVTIAPQRSGYQNLMEASRRTGDVQTAQLCQTILNNSDLPSDISVKQLSQDDFAKTYRPVSYQMNSSTSDAQPENSMSPADETKAAKKPWYSIFK